MIGDVVENQTLEMENVLHYRSWLTQQQANAVFIEAEELMNKQQATKNGYVATITHAVDMCDGQPTMDLEVFLPLDKEIEPSDGFDFIKQFKIEKALKLRIEGSPQQTQAAMQILSKHIQNNSLQPSTPVCMVTVKGAITPLEIEDMITDIYIGVMGE